MSNFAGKAEQAIESIEGIAEKYHATDLEKRTRSAQNFEETESQLPNIRASQASDGRPDLVDDVLSHFGKHNPFPHPISSSDTVWLLDNTAYRSPKAGEWQAEFVAAVFDQNTGLKVSTVVAKIVEKLGLAKGGEEEKTITKRLIPFMQSLLPARVVDVKLIMVQS
jgi:hypothetical protein